MGFNTIIENIQIFLLVFARVFALISIAPLISSSAIPAMARVGLAFFASVLAFPIVLAQGYMIPDTGLGYVALIIGEIMIGLIMGFFLVVIFSAFLVAGQFFSLQMGFGASEVFDPLAQVQIPIMGQFLNIIAMFLFIIIGGLQRIFLVGVLRSFQAAKAIDFVAEKDYILRMIIESLSGLFEQALVISFPILGTLVLVSVSMGLLAKAAPQMNLLMMGFPVAIGVAFTILFLALPFMVEGFAKIIDMSFVRILEMLDRVKETAG
jgi:flagellar biosynthetic protein FliR